SHLLVVAFRIDETELIAAFRQPLDYADRGGRFPAARRPGHQDAATVRFDADLTAVLMSEKDIVAGERRLNLAQVVRDELLDEFRHPGAVIRFGHHVRALLEHRQGVGHGYRALAQP